MSRKAAEEDLWTVDVGASPRNGSARTVVALDVHANWQSRSSLRRKQVTFSSGNHGAASKASDADAGVEDAQERICALETEVTALRVELREREWAAERAIELGSALASSTESNTKLRKELEELHQRIAKLGQVYFAQVLLLEQLRGGSEGDAADSSQMPRPATVDDVASTLTSRLKQFSCELAQLRSSAVCVRCLEREEATHRRELVLAETDAFFQLDCKAERLRRTHAYIIEQCTQSEVECMWREDLLAHSQHLASLQSQIGSIECLQRRATDAEQRAARCEGEMRKLRRDLQEELHSASIAHQEQLVAVRTACLRANPSSAVLRHLLLGCVKAHHAHGRLLYAAAVLRKRLVVVRAEVSDFRRAFKATLDSVSSSVLDAVRQCMPIVWAPVALQPCRRASPQRSEERRRRVQDVSQPRVSNVGRLPGAARTVGPPSTAASPAVVFRRSSAPATK